MFHYYRSIKQLSILLIRFILGGPVHHLPVWRLSILLIRFQLPGRLQPIILVVLSILLIRFSSRERSPTSRKPGCFQFYWLDSPLLAIRYFLEQGLSILLIRFATRVGRGGRYREVTLSILLIRFGWRFLPVWWRFQVLSILLIRFAPLRTGRTGTTRTGFQFYWLDSRNCST